MTNREDEIFQLGHYETMGSRFFGIYKWGGRGSITILVPRLNARASKLMAFVVLHCFWNKYQPPGIESLAGVEINESSLSQAG